MACLFLHQPVWLNISKLPHEREFNPNPTLLIQYSVPLRKAEHAASHMKFTGNHADNQKINVKLTPLKLLADQARPARDRAVRIGEQEGRGVGKLRIDGLNNAIAIVKGNAKPIR